MNPASTPLTAFQCHLHIIILNNHDKYQNVLEYKKILGHRFLIIHTLFQNTVLHYSPISWFLAILGHFSTRHPDLHLVAVIILTDGYYSIVSFSVEGTTTVLKQVSSNLTYLWFTYSGPETTVYSTHVVIVNLFVYQQTHMAPLNYLGRPLRVKIFSFSATSL